MFRQVFRGGNLFDGRPLSNKNEPKAAAAQYEKEIQVNPQVEARRAAELDPKNYAPHYVLGRALTEMDRPADSIRELELATRLSPSNANVHLSLAQAYQRAGKTQLAEQEMRAFKSLDEARKKQKANRVFDSD
jgi:predicted Zn-dependent protease